MFKKNMCVCVSIMSLLWKPLRNGGEAVNVHYANRIVVQTADGRGPDISRIVTSFLIKCQGSTVHMDIAKICTDAHRCAKMLRTMPANILFHLPRLLEPGDDT